MNKKTETKKYDYPSIGKKSTATFIDLGLLFFAAYLIAGNTGIIDGQPFIGKLFFFLIIILIYEPVLTVFGATLGQFLTNTRIRHAEDHEKPVGFAMAVVRTFLKYTTGIISIFGNNKQEYYDKMTKCMVIEFKEIDESTSGGRAAAFLKNKWFKFGFALFIYLLMMIWIGSWYLLIGLPVLYDIYISKKVRWAFWKRKPVDGKKKSFIAEWVDAIIFAVVAATLIRMFFIEAYTIPTPSMEKDLLVGDFLFVSKVSYGPKVPNTPLSFPFVHHTMPLTKSTKSYLEWIYWPYKRLAGLTSVKNNDRVVFNFPAGDTVIVRYQSTKTYYQELYTVADSICRLKGDSIWEKYIPGARKIVLGREEIVVRPVDKRENYIKRCVAIPGDKVQIIHSELLINDKPVEGLNDMQFRYLFFTNGPDVYLDETFREKYQITKKEFAEGDFGVFSPDVNAFESYVSAKDAEKIKKMKPGRFYMFTLRPSQVKEAARYPKLQGLIKFENTGWDPQIFPNNRNFEWNVDNFGPITLPEAGQTIKLTLQNLPIYQRIIDLYEENDLEVKNGKIYINGAETNEYTFKMGYYWLMGDNRHNSQDSRFWGFVPEDHIVGKAVFIWLSLDDEKSGFGKIRWNRMFTLVHKE